MTGPDLYQLFAATQGVPEGWRWYALRGVGAAGGNVDEIDRALAGEASCDKCEGPNDRAAFANYCTRCSNEYSARHAGDPEYRPVGGR